jgi:hypothetical protein
MSFQYEEQMHSSSNPATAAFSNPAVTFGVAKNVELLTEDVSVEDAGAPFPQTATYAIAPIINPLPVTPVSGQDIVLYLDDLDLSRETIRPFHFDGPDRWQRALHFRNTYSRPPNIQPASDPTIIQVLRERKSWVAELCKAIMIDNRTCGQKSFELGQYDAKKVEATGRCISWFDVTQCFFPSTQRSVKTLHFSCF